jgi:phosphohistidine phosphatase
MKTLLLMRHAKSDRDDPTFEDHERPLTERGKKAAKRMGQLLHDEHLVPDLILSSTAVRARKTASKVAKKTGYAGAIELHRRVYMADPATLLAVVQELVPNRDRVLVIGHNPGMSDFLSELTKSMQDMPTATVAQIELPVKNWCEIDWRTRGKLITLWRPRELDS